MRPLVAWLLLLQVALGDSCASEKFTDAGACCSLCPAGFGVEVECGRQDTECRPCPQGTFSEGLGPCLPCSKCSSSAPMAAACTAAEDTQCRCKPGSFFLAQSGWCASCSKCNRGEGAVRQCGLRGDVQCRVCGPGSFMEEHRHSKPCQTCTQCSDSEVEIRACMANSDTLCMDKKLHILSRPAEADGSRDSSRWPVTEEYPAPGTPKFTPQDEGGGGNNNILLYVSVLAAVVLGLLVYVAYKCWRSCKQKKALSKARAAELGASPEGEKLQSDSGVFLDSHSVQDSQLNKGTKRDSKLDNRLYVNLAVSRQQEVEALLQDDASPGWRQLGAAFGYQPEQLDLFGRGEAPAHTLLSNWAQKEGSTLGLLCSALARMERSDVVTVLYSPMQGVSVV
ncbi:tumor necrosis factor receptor superfamily member 16 [Synchiropus splendidus]|uniref:tumor necrosis factor receptor superfamily member 16 n=1 Tax=Synchiropus splendidus TaxID=270530 RepID=UPI00237DD6D8|nr:tumor necrosis factor receptor superfamily member 16 [Synchiropus splendidus]